MTLGTVAWTLSVGGFYGAMAATAAVVLVMASLLFAPVQGRAHRARLRACMIAVSVLLGSVGLMIMGAILTFRTVGNLPLP